LEMHFRLALQLGHALQEGFTVEPDGAAQGIVGIEHSAETEGKYGCTLKAFADYVGMLQESRLFQVPCGDVLADDHGELAAGIRKGLRLRNAFQVFYGNRPAGSNAPLKCLLLNNAVRVPCHRCFSCRKNLGGRYLICLNGRKYCEEHL